eukprot:Sspe_Gene.105828::Locus_82943_Transcript_1_1_Confidence_1.000_Length_594::g.105828::m.105828
MQSATSGPMLLSQPPPGPLVVNTSEPAMVYEVYTSSVSESSDMPPLFNAATDTTVSSPASSESYEAAQDTVVMVFHTEAPQMSPRSESSAFYSSPLLLPQNAAPSHCSSLPLRPHTPPHTVQSHLHHPHPGQSPHHPPPPPPP